jgi:hypothetical protein
VSKNVIAQVLQGTSKGVLFETSFWTNISRSYSSPEKIVLCFDNSELFRRFGILTQAEQQVLAEALLGMANKYPNADSLEIEFDWTPDGKKRRIQMRKSVETSGPRQQIVHQLTLKLI